MNATEQPALLADLAGLEAAHAALKRRNLRIDMTRGKPAPDQLDLSDAIATLVAADDCRGEDGADYRN